MLAACQEPGSTSRESSQTESAVLRRRLLAGCCELVAMACEVGCEPLVVLTGEPVGGFVTDRPVGIGDAPAKPVELDVPCSLAPPPTPVRILGRSAEGRQQVVRRVVLVDVDVLVGEVNQLSGELAVLPPGRLDGFGVGQPLEFSVDLGELTLKRGEVGALLLEMAGGLLPCGATATPDSAGGCCEAPVAVCDGCCEAVDVGCEPVAPCGQLT